MWYYYFLRNLNYLNQSLTEYGLLKTTLTTFPLGNVHGVIVRAVRRDKNTPQRRGSNLFNFDDNINNLRPNQLPGALKGSCCKDNSGQLGCQLMSIRG